MATISTVVNPRFRVGAFGSFAVYSDAEAAAGGDIPGTLALLHLAGGASACVERHADGATVFGAVDTIGRHYSYNPVLAEGADAQVHRDRVASGLLPCDYDAAYQRGAGLSLSELITLSTGLMRAR
jgi:hypothetical protein